MDTIDALKRLERAGSENSKATAKLHEAASELAGRIIKAVPANVTLPRDYRVVKVKSNVGEESFLVHGQADELDYDHWIDGTGKYLHGDCHCDIPPQTREGSLQFAKDIAEGLLDEIAEFLDQRQCESDSATETLLAAREV
jgi:hypothetical protein